MPLAKRRTARMRGAGRSGAGVRPDRVACAHRLLTNLGRASAPEARARPYRAGLGRAVSLALPYLRLSLYLLFHFHVIVFFLRTFPRVRPSCQSSRFLSLPLVTSRRIALLFDAGFKRKTAMRHENLANFRINEKQTTAIVPSICTSICQIQSFLPIFNNSYLYHLISILK